MAEKEERKPETSDSFHQAAMDELASRLRIKLPDHPRIEALQTRLRSLTIHYRQLIATVPSDLPGAPFPQMTLTKRHEWIDSNILNPVARIKEALSDKNRPLLSTWPEFMDRLPEVNIETLAAELDRLESFGKFLWMSARLRRNANVSVGWEIKYEIVRALAGLFAEIAPKLTPSRGTYDQQSHSYIGSFPEAITFAYREITGFDDNVDRQIADYVEESQSSSTS